MNFGINNLNLYFHSDKCNIMYIEINAMERSDLGNFLSKLKKSDYLFIQFPYNIEHTLMAFRKNDIKTFYVCMLNYAIEKYKNNNGFDVTKNVIFCAPTEKVRDMFIEFGLTSILLNHNCFLNYNNFVINNNNELNRKYNAVINSRPYWWKRVYLASKVDKLLYIKGQDYTNDNSSWNGYKEMNLTLKSHISPKKVVELYNESRVGLILSGNTGKNQQYGAEGANYSSSEYLLCGLPVISTESQGGRDYWFDNYNSIICEPNEESVQKSVDIMLQKLNSGEINREKIRNKKIEKIKLMRENFINETKKIYSKHNINIDSRKYFNANFYHKMTEWNQKKVADNISLIIKN